MQNVMNPLVTMCQMQLEASRRFADAVFSSTEKIDRVMLDATHRFVTEHLNLAEAVTSLRDPVTAGATFQASLFSGSRNKAADYQKEIMRIISEMQNEIGRSWEDYVQQLRAQASGGAVKPFEATQTRANDAMLDPMKSMFSVWESAFKEVSDLARKNMGAAYARSIDAAATGMPGATSYADAGGDLAKETVRTTAETTVNATDAEAVSEERKGPSPGAGGKKK